MVETKQATIAAIILMLFSGAGLTATSNFLTQEQFNNAYVCSMTEEAKWCYGGLSGSEERCYPTEGTRKGYKDCVDVIGTRGPWIPLIQYAADNDMQPEDFFFTEETPVDISVPTTQGRLRYDCSTEKCEVKR